MLARILKDASATQILKGVDVLLAIWWLQESWNKVANLTIKNCFKKCGIKGYNELIKVEEDDDLKFAALVKEFTADISAAEYVNFNKNIPASELMINELKIIWRQQVIEKALMQFRIQKLQVIRSKRFWMMTGAMTRMMSWNKKSWVSKR